MKTKLLDRWMAFRERKQPTTTIVLHATAGGNLIGAITTLFKKGFSYHYLIDKDGSVTKCVPVSKKALHAGVSKGPDGDNVNRYSIGISFVNKNDGQDPYTIEQTRAARELCVELKTYIPTIKYLTTHWAISPGRKTDPKNFPAVQFAKDVKLKFWPS